MAKQKFYCKGVVRKTGQRVAITVTADSKEMAVKIAEQHDVKVESIAPVADGVAEPAKPAAKPAPVQPKPAASAAPVPPKPAASAAPIQPKPVAVPTPAAPKVAPKVINARLDEILNAEDEADDGLGDFDLGDEADKASAAPDALSTKACPYCGEQILTVALKCKHCGERLPSDAMRPNLSAVAPLSAKSDAAGVISLICGIMAFLVFIVGCLVLHLLAFLTYPASFVFAVGGLVSGLFAKGNLRVAGIFLNILAAIPGIVAFILLIAGLVMVGALERDLGVAKEPVMPTPVKAPQAVQPKTEPPKASAEELAYAAKLVAFLDSCDELTRMLEKGAKPDQCEKQSKTIKARQAAIPQPPQGVAWAKQSYDSISQLLMPVIDAVTLSGAGNDLVGELLKQTAGSAPDNSQGSRMLAEQLRKLVAEIRRQIPPACLPKPK